MKKKMEKIKIKDWTYSGNREVVFISSLKDFNKVVEGCFELPDGTLIGISDIIIYIHELK